MQDDVEEAQKLLAHALILGRESTDIRDLIQALDAMGRLAQWQGDYERAHNLHRESLTLSVEIDHRARIAYALEAFACLAVAQGQLDRAASLFGAADRCFPATTMYMATTVTRDPCLQIEHDRLVAFTQEELGEAAFAVAWATGEVMALAQAVNYALNNPQGNVN